MPFYFRIPLPGPFGYSARVGGRKRKKVKRVPTRPALILKGWQYDMVKEACVREGDILMHAFSALSPADAQKWITEHVPEAGSGVIRRVAK